jgi:hypothetical protein
MYGLLFLTIYFLPSFLLLHSPYLSHTKLAPFLFLFPILSLFYTYSSLHISATLSLPFSHIPTFTTSQLFLIPYHLLYFAFVSPHIYFYIFSFLSLLVSGNKVGQQKDIKQAIAIKLYERTEGFMKREKIDRMDWKISKNLYKISFAKSLSNRPKHLKAFKMYY